MDPALARRSSGKDRVPKPPATWAEMLQMARQIGPAQAAILVQGQKYEGFSVWFISLEATAGGQVLTPDLKHVALPAGPTRRRWASCTTSRHCPGAPSNLSTMKEDEARLAFEQGQATFMVNYAFVYPSAKKDAPDVYRNMGWAEWPRIDPGEPSHVTVGGINLGVGAYSRHPQLAFQAAACLHESQHQVTAAVKGGLAPTTDALYDDQAIQAALPMARLCGSNCATPRHGR